MIKKQSMKKTIGNDTAPPFSLLMMGAIILCFGILLTFGGCSLVSNSTGSEDFKSYLESSQKNKSERDSETTPAMVKGGDTIITNHGDGTITLEKPTTDANSAEIILKNLEAEMLKAQGSIKNLLTEKEENESKHSERIEMHKTWHTVSAVVIGAKIILIIVLFVVFRGVPAALKQYGINPKHIGAVIPKLLKGAKILQRSKKRAHKELEYISRTMAANGISDETKGELKRQKDSIHSDLRDMETIDFDS